MCKHLEALIDEAILQFGLDRVARYLRVDLGAEPGDGPEVIKALRGPASTAGAAAAAPVFSRFLRHLAYLELAPTTVPLPEMQWFPPCWAAR
jgi:hypothetical protein